MDRRILLLFAATALSSAGGCTNPQAPQAAVAVPARSTALPAPTAAAPPPAAAPSTAAPAPSAAPPPGGNLARIEPDEIRTVMVDLNLAHALDLCGFPTLGSFIRDYTQKRIDACPNSAERRAALHSLIESQALREQRLADEARSQGDPPHCYASDQLTVIKEMIPIAQRTVARAERPMDCGDISSAQR